MRRRSILVIGLLCATLLSNVLAQNGADLLQKALRKEKVDGDLTGAIDLYRQIANEARSSRALTAQALVQLGKAYEKMGASEARAAYAKVVSDFADQSREVDEAKVRLAALEEEASAKDEKTPIAQLVVSDRIDRWLAYGDTTVSPNGKYLAYINWDHGNLAFYATETGEKRDLTTEGTWAGKTNQFAGTAVWSPDSARIGYLWNMGPRGELRLIDRNGGNSKLLVGGRFDPQSWSKDGKYIYALGPFHRPIANAREFPAAIVRVEVATGATNVIKQFSTNDHAITLSLSPDGKYLAYSYWQGTSATNSIGPNIRVISADGSVERSLIEHPAADVTPVWMPDGKHIVFVSNRSGSDALWAIRVSNGSANGEARLLRDGIAQGQNIGMTDDGTVYFYSRTPNFNIYTAQANFDEGTLSAPKLVSLRYDGKNRNPRWSSNGLKIGYVSWREPAVLVFHDITTGKEDDVKTEWGFKDRPAWSPNLEQLVGPAKAPNQPGAGLFNVEVRTGRRSLLMEVKDDASLPVFTPDGKHLIFCKHSWAPEDKHANAVVELDLETKEERVISHELGSYNRQMALSPDGLRLAAAITPYPLKNGDTVQVVVASRADGAMRTVAKFPVRDYGRAQVYDWLPDNRRVIVAFDGNDDGQQLYVVDTENGASLPLGARQTKGEALWSMHVHRDGKRVVFERGDMRREFWSLKNFLPKEEQAANNQPTIRQVATDKLGPYVAFGDGRPSPDGRYLAYVNWTHGNLALADLETGSVKDLTTNGTWNPPDQFAFPGVWSPDGRQIAFIWMIGSRGELRTIPRDGGDSRLLVPSEKGGAIVPHAWSKDGRHIYGVSFPDSSEGPRTNSIYRVDVATGAVKELARFPGRTAWVTLAVSPDERYIAYDFPGAYQVKYMRQDPVPSEIRIMRIDGTGDRALIEHPADDVVPHWMPDSGHLVFVSDRSGSGSMWTVATRDGIAVSEPRLLRAAAKPMGVTDDGTFYYAAESQSYNVFTADVDFTAGTLGAAKLASVRYDGKNRNPSWSEDGTKLGYVSRRDLATLVFQDAVTGRESEVELMDAPFGQVPDWSPDLTRLVGRARVAGGNIWGLFQIDVHSRRQSMVVEHSASWGRFTRNGKHLIYQKDLPSGGQVVELNLADKTERIIATNRLRGPALSRDGRFIAHWQRPYPAGPGTKAQLLLMSTQDGSVRQAREYASELEAHVLDWLPDSRHLLLSTAAERNGQQMLLVDTQSSVDRPFGKPLHGDDQIRMLSIHPNGKRIAFQRGRQVEEIWTMQNFLAEEKLRANK